MSGQPHDLGAEVLELENVRAQMRSQAATRKE